jgi:initiation factor 1A
MVKNTRGGSGHKKFGRKHTTGFKSNNKLRISEDVGEMYAIVTKMNGNSMFNCHCLDSVVRLGHIRGKFSGRGKRDNMVECGKWVLIGLRQWDVSSEKSSCLLKDNDKIQHCDLLEVYSDADKQRLKETICEDWAELDRNDKNKIIMGETKEEDDGFVFGTDRDFDRVKLVKEINSITSEKILFEDKSNEEDIVDFDCI